MKIAVDLNSAQSEQLEAIAASLGLAAEELRRRRLPISSTPALPTLMLQRHGCLMDFRIRRRRFGRRTRCGYW